MNILIVGQCGVGKTWVIKELIGLSETVPAKIGLVDFRLSKDFNVAFAGKYTGTTFDGSDRLSMAVSKDFIKFKKCCDKNQLSTIVEGDRFMNKKYLDVFKPTILKILGDGEVGRKARGSNQTEQHLKRIATRVSNVEAVKEFESSTECYKWIRSKYFEKS